VRPHPYEWAGTALLYCGRTTGLAVTSTAPGLWRVSSPDGTVSGVTNLTRAKDAASWWHASTTRKERQAAAQEAGHAA
jgi:hypothetical protein